MRVSVSVHYIGIVVAIVGISMLLCAGVGIIYHDDSVDELLVAGFMVFGLGIFPVILVPVQGELSLKEAIFTVAGSWFATGIIGAFPFYLWGPPFDLVNSIFESFSGFTTTGSSILFNIESLPKGILFWRSFTHFLGGMGIVVLAIVILPTLGQVSNILMKQEYSGGQRIFPRAKTVAHVIFSIYLGLNLLEIVALMAAGMNLFDASTTAFATIATGGFSVRNLSIASYGSPLIEIIIMIFMTISGINFAFLFLLLFSRKWNIKGWETVRFYLIAMGIGVLIVVVSLSVHSKSLTDALRYGSFQVISVATSTGFATADSSVWVSDAKFVLVFFTLICAMAGSTSGGIKIDRLMIFFKLLRQQYRHFIHPNMIMTVRIGKSAMDMQFANDAILFIVLYLSVVTLSTLALSITGADLTEAFTGSAACMGNVGPGLGKIGSMGNYSYFTDWAKLILAAVMLIGRLEIYVILVPLSRSFWKA